MAIQLPDEIAKRHNAVQLEGGYICLTHEFISPKADQLLSYWDDKRAGRDMPDWSDIELIEIWDLAPWLMVKERTHDLEWRNRFYGTALAKRLERDATGLLVREYHPEHEVGDILKGYEMMIEGRSPLRCLGYFVQEGKEHLPYEGIYLPLTSGGDNVEMMLAIPDYEYTL